MPWYLWMGLGAALVVIGLTLFIAVANRLDDRAEARRRAVCERQSEAQRSIEATVQRTIRQMFDAARDYR